MRPELAAFLTALGEAGLAPSRPVPEPEGEEYGAHTVEAGGRTVAFRIGKTTPTKVGQFVTAWRRSAAGPIRPLDAADGVALLVIASYQDDRGGYFVFPRDVLVSRGVFADGARGGKRGFRIYPPWVEPPAGQATRTRSWQVEHFLDASADGALDPARIASVFAVSAHG
ncbi:MepB family protein [Tsukamurella strandjordii]|uniref:MepB family protein n=1 Tax=Tsukamurella strandjordii TaxID=147577 RepID=A0AA90NEB9_9ACTN|nr:MepB family protein [Tsukamurella strandjordii]MDP0400368.1 MepB family protein [Tsukamurella strandjordii]